MWIYRRMLRISYVDRVTNEEVLHRVKQERSLVAVFERRQKAFIGHSIRKAKLEELSLSGKIPGRRARGGQRITLLKNINKDVRNLWKDALQRKF